VNTITDAEIDWARYEQDYPEQRHVVPASHYADAVVDYFHGQHDLGRGATLPWSKTHADIHLRPGELSLWNGINGHGKSLLLNQVGLGLMMQGQGVVIASMEMKPTLTMARMSRQASGTNLPTVEYIRIVHDWLDSRLWIYDHVGTVTPKRITGLARYITEALYQSGKRQHVHHLVIDSLLKCGIAEDDYNGQKAFVDKLSAFAHDTGLHIHLVVHSRKGESERNTPGKWDIRGAGAISDLAENVFTVWRNKVKEEMARLAPLGPEDRGQPDALLICDKQRNGDWEGRVALWFEAASLQFVASPGARAIDFLRSAA